MKAALLALVALLIGASPVFAGLPSHDGLYLRSWVLGERTIVVLRANDQGARVSVAVDGLVDGADYLAIGTTSDGDCGTAPSTANRTLSLRIDGSMVDEDGTFFVGQVTGTIWTTTDFIRIKRVGGAAPVCGPTNRFDLGTPAELDYARFPNAGEDYFVLAERTAPGEARVSVALGDVTGDGAVDGVDLAVRGSTASCGAGGGTTVFRYELDDVVVSSFRSQTFAVSQTRLNTMRSVRIRALSGGSGTDWFWAVCRPIIVANTEGDIH